MVYPHTLHLPRLAHYSIHDDAGGKFVRFATFLAPHERVVAERLIRDEGRVAAELRLEVFTIAWDDTLTYTSVMQIR